MKAGDPIAQQGTIIDPVLLSLFASLRITTVPVISNPRVGILAVGNELVALHDHQGNGKIVASNLFMLSAFVESMGAQVAFAHVTNNNEEAILKDLEKGKQCDLIITTGGTAHGLSDRTRMVLKKAGTRFLFTGIRAVPGKGTSFGFYGKTPIFSLPGTPPSVFTIFHTLIHPCLMTLMGYPGRFPIVVSAILENRVHKKPGMTHFVNAHVHQKEGRYGVHPLTGPRGGLFYSMAQANGFMVVPEDRTRLEKGEAVAVHLLRSPSPCAFSAGLAGTHGKQDTPPPCVSIVGKSNAGKTTLLEKLIPELTRRGYKVGTIKHDVHGFDIDHEGKDTWRHKKAGAATVTISSPAKVAVIQDVTMEKPLHRLVERYYGNRDIVLTEGYKKEKMPKIEIFRKSAHKEPLCTNDEDLVAMVSDTTIDVGVPRFSLDDIKGLADLLEKKFLQPPPNPPAY